LFQFAGVVIYFVQLLFPLKSRMILESLEWVGTYLVLVSELQTINDPQELGEISESHQLGSLGSLMKSTYRPVEAG